MEKETRVHPEVIESKTPDKESRVSLFLNGIGNGMMLGTIPFVAVELVSRIAQKEHKIPQWANKANLFALVSGSALGGWWGVREANKLSDYRRSVLDELFKLHNEIMPPHDTAAAPPQAAGQQWADRVSAAEPANSAPKGRSL